MDSAAPPVPPTRPKNAVVILLDSLNRHMVGAYGGKEFATPNLDAFAAGAVRFEKHYAGSLPCMPARHDILCGALDFLWRRRDISHGQLLSHLIGPCVHPLTAHGHAR